MNTNVKDRLRCAYEDCAEAHPLANESTYEQVTCLTCRAALGLPPTEIYKNSGATIAATPKPRAGEHTKWPWRVGKPQGGRGLVWADGVAVADCLNGDGSADARRIVACVNACEGIPTEILSGVGDVLPVTFAKVSAERDLLRGRERELVEVLEHFREWHANHFEDFSAGVNAELLCLANEAEAALAKHGR